MCTVARSELLFKRFCFEYEVGELNDMKQYLKEFSEPRDKNTNPKIENQRVQRILKEYQQFEERVSAGEYGVTAQYYGIFLRLMDCYFLHSRSIRTGNYELYINVLPYMNDIFFAFNLFNYARWMTRLHHNYLNVESTHPGLRDSHFKRGSFSVRRTGKDFSRQPTDFVIEETHNADAARSTGISNFTDSIGASQRWCILHSLRTSIRSKILNLTGMKKEEDIFADLRKSNISINCAFIRKIKYEIINNINPFSPSLDANFLFNISTGKSAKPNTAKFLLSVESDGKSLKDGFINERANDPKRFEMRRSLVKVLSFASEKIVKKVKVNGKETTLIIQRDIFGRLLVIALKNKVSVLITLSYPLSPIPLVFCRPDGSICKTNKSQLANYILKITTEETDDPIDPNIFTYVIHDGFCLLNKLVNVPVTYGELSTKILDMITKSIHLQRVDLIFDTYPDGPTIKDYKHKLRQNVRDNYTIRSGL